jgi:hypothetical protein
MLHDDLDMSVGEPTRDLRTTLNCFDGPSLRRLDSAFEMGRVITKKYVDSNGRGCLLFWLTDQSVKTKPELLKYDFGVVPDGLPAARRVIRYWDWGTLTVETVRAELKSALAVRREAETAEDEAVERTNRTLELARI